ncbi:amidohydrolase family protein [Sinanaerobacter chloroacetimidivorans]|uniref:Amidohydrolase n=1 Tax=Sinanaerobacter chloroacetimidivorans TaxID=2818044 RepID=A0A8J8B2V0_9FIRM|nr:amidohydrolase family protein [Sinanaerobacter chloroacetimidivorans]MBR0599111.1 amidohydrolase [Sinanaerobacter chloroacetimidivorans]
MLHKIGLEEHFAIPETLGCSEKYFPKEVWPKFSKHILDLMEIRINQMDENGMEMMILSLNSPAIQAIYDRKEAVEVAKKANDIMAEAIAKNPKRFRGFAALPMQDPDAAIMELHRSVKELGCVGVLVNGYSQIDSQDEYKYLDDPIYRPFWAEVEKLDVPFYMHPREPMPCNSKMLAGHPWLDGAAWSFGVETATHTLRLMCSGIFDEFPNLKYILGHLGETLPFCIWRTANRIRKENRGIPAKRALPEYMEQNMWLTTSGQFRTAALWNTIMEFGADRILFATDFPFEEVKDACVWFDNCSISENDRVKIGRDNIIKLFNLT